MATFSNLFQTNTCSNQRTLAIPSQRTFQKLTPLRVKFQNPQWSQNIQSPAELKLPTINPQRNQISEHSPHRDTSHQIEDSQSYFSSISLPGSGLPSRDHQNSHSPQVTKDFSNPSGDPKIPQQLKILFPKQSAANRDVSAATIKDSCNSLQQSRIHFPRQQSRFYYLRLSKIHLSSARQLISLHAHSLHSYHKHWYNIYCIIHFMQHNFVFQLIFYPFQDKIDKLRLLKTVYGFSRYGC